MNKTEIKIEPITSSDARRSSIYTSEVVLYNMEPSKEGKKNNNSNPIIWSSNVKHQKLLKNLQTTHALEEGNQPFRFYQQPKKDGIDEIIFYSLGSIVVSGSSWFRLDSFTNVLRNIGGEIIRGQIQKKQSVQIIINLGNYHKATNVALSLNEILTALLEGLYLGSYQYHQYKQSRPSRHDIHISIGIAEKDYRSIRSDLVSQAKIVATSVNRARDLVNDPPNVLTSELFSKIARQISNDLKVDCKVLNKEQLKKNRMNALLAVNAGSKHGARLVILDNRRQLKTNGAKKNPMVLLIGKGVLFDSGGLSLKPSSAMNGMKMDMAGGAAVLSAFEALVKVKSQARIIAMIPLTDNMTGENAMKVGDIITSRSGKSVEVLNTDAEGRLILCDTLDYGIKTYRPDYIIDLATLTGAAMVALGTYYAGLFSKDDVLSEKLLSSSKFTDEPLWRLPLDDAYAQELNTEVADLKNIGSSYGGAITAAKFLEQFIPESYRNKWAHIDIAPVMDVSQTKGYQVKGGRGFGVRLLVDFVTKLMVKHNN